MPVRREIPYDEGLYFITFTCYKWLPLFEYTNGYDIVYNWFDYLKTQNHDIIGYVIMPNHLHVMISFSKTEKNINKIIGDGKRFVAYEIINTLEQKNPEHLLEKLEKAVSITGKKRGKKHEVWEESFDWKFCETAKFANQKLVYMHNNPCAGKWKLVVDATKYEHSSARFYISGKHAGYKVKNIEELIVKWLNRPESATHKA
jgi:REP element-mobilizing transposase RayT